MDLVSNNANPIPLKCNGTGRDKDHDKALAFYFNRRVTDDELRFLDEVMKRAAACMRNDLVREEETDAR